MITLERAKQLQYGDILINNEGKRWKVNGQVQTWKTDPNRIRVPLKHGLYSFDTITELDFRNGECSLLTLEDELSLDES